MQELIEIDEVPICSWEWLATDRYSLSIFLRVRELIEIGEVPICSWGWLAIGWKMYCRLAVEMHVDAVPVPDVFSD